MSDGERATYHRMQENKKRDAELRKANNPKLVPRATKALVVKQQGAFSTSTLLFPSTKPASLDFPKGKIRPTKGQLKPRKKKGKGKGKKRARSADSSEESGTDGEQEEEDVIEYDVPR